MGGQEEEDRSRGWTGEALGAAGDVPELFRQVTLSPQGKGKPRAGNVLGRNLLPSA